MIALREYDELFYSSHSLTLENLNLTVTMDGGVLKKEVEQCCMHNHPVFELHAILSGELVLNFADTEDVKLSENEICLIPPDFYHGVIPLTDATRLTLRFSFRRNDLQDTEDFCTLFSLLTRPITLGETEPLIDLLIRIREEVLSPAAASTTLCRAYLSELFVLLYRRLGEQCTVPNQGLLSDSDDENARYNKIEILMQRHMAEFFREEDLAEALGLSVRQTSRVMQKIFGMSFRQKLLSLRLHHAKGLLLTSDEPVEKIAATVGYTSPSGFHIAFKKAFGYTPYSYRALNSPKNFNSGT